MILIDELNFDFGRIFNLNFIKIKIKIFLYLFYCFYFYILWKRMEKKENFLSN